MLLPLKESPDQILKLKKESSKRKNRGQKYVRIIDSSKEN